MVAKAKKAAPAAAAKPAKKIDLSQVRSDMAAGADVSAVLVNLVLALEALER